MNDAVRTAEAAMGLSKQITIHLLTMSNRMGDVFLFAFRTRADLEDFAFREIIARMDELGDSRPTFVIDSTQKWATIVEFCNQTEGWVHTDTDTVEIFPTDLITGA